MSKWFIPIPVYVTRKNGDGEIGTWSVGAVWGLIIVILALVNVIGWEIYGVCELIAKLT